LNGQWRQQMQQFGASAGTNNAATPQQWSQFWSQYAGQLNGILTPDQQQTWAQLTGRQYVFPQSAFFPQTTTQNNPPNTVVPAVPRSRATQPSTATTQGTTTPTTQGTVR